MSHGSLIFLTHQAGTDKLIHLCGTNNVFIFILIVAIKSCCKSLWWVRTPIYTRPCGQTTTNTSAWRFFCLCLDMVLIGYIHYSATPFGPRQEVKVVRLTENITMIVSDLTHINFKQHSTINKLPVHQNYCRCAA